jgi:hypothetical protein
MIGISILRSSLLFDGKSAALAYSIVSPKSKSLPPSIKLLLVACTQYANHQSYASVIQDHLHLVTCAFCLLVLLNQLQNEVCLDFTVNSSYFTGNFADS